MSEKLNLPCLPPSFFGMKHLMRYNPGLDISELKEKDTLTADEVLGLINCSSMYLCSDCLCLNGEWSYSPESVILSENYIGTYEQVHHGLDKCRKTSEPNEVEHTASCSELHTNRKIDLCWCCGQALIPTGSRWSTFFCPACKQFAIELNEAAGSCVIPIGRHSIANGIIGRPAPQESTEAFSEAFTQEVKTMNSRIDRLRSWKRMIRHELIVASKLNREKNIPISVYGSALLSAEIKPEYTFIPMVKYVLGRISKEQLVIRMPYTGIFWPEYGFERLVQERNGNLNSVGGDNE